MKMTGLCRAMLVAGLATLCAAATADAQATSEQTAGPQTTGALIGAASETDEAPAAAAQAPTLTSSWPPPYQERRFEENWLPPDWSDPHKGARDVFDKIKAIRLDPNGTNWIGVGGQARGRMARQSTVFYGGPFEFQPVMWTWMFRAHADLHVGEHFRAFGEGIYSHSSINGNRLGGTAPNVNGDILNAFGEYTTTIKKWKTGFWAGRHELQMGHERILSPGNWLLNRHTYDGTGGWMDNGEHRVEGFFVRPRIPVPDAFSTKDDTTNFWGFFYTTNFVHRPSAEPGAPPKAEQHVFFQPYLLRIKRKSLAFVQGTADEDRYTMGLLTYGDVGSTGLDFEFEGVYQYGRYEPVFGEVGRIHAFSGTIESGYRFKTVRFAPRPYLSFDYASGDRDQNDKQLNTFDPLYPLAWQFFGFHAAFERKNLEIAGLHLDAVLRKDTYFKATYWPVMWRAQANDGVYDSFGNIVRRPEPQSSGGSSIDLSQASRKIGQQLDVGVAFLPTHHLLFYVTYLHFFAGPFFARNTDRTDARHERRDGSYPVQLLRIFCDARDPAGSRAVTQPVSQPCGRSCSGRRSCRPACATRRQPPTAPFST